MKALLEISSCKDCPHLERKRVYTEDSWERGFDWLCSKSNGKTIEPFVEWYEENKVTIPEWCPIKEKK